MSLLKDTYDLMIIGGGPRGFYALESLCEQCAREDVSLPRIALLEPFHYYGSGPVWNPELSESNRANVSYRKLSNLKSRAAIRLQSVEIPAFPSFQEWYDAQGFDTPSAELDIYPSRATIGSYLYDRARSLREVLESNQVLDFIDERASTLQCNDSGRYEVPLPDMKKCIAEHVLLTIGHQDTRLDPQLADWKCKCDNLEIPFLIEDPYPLERWMSCPEINSDTVVAMRGIGLTAFDILRALTIERGGRFEDVEGDRTKLFYHPSECTPRCIVPFSLDGRPASPKPMNKEIDELFKPSEEELGTFRTNLRSALSEGSTDHSTFFIRAMSEVTSQVASRFISDTSVADLESLIVQWTNDTEFQHPLIQETKVDILQNMKAYLDMATGRRGPSLDYIHGQVWRFCQPTIYAELSHSNLGNDVMAAIIDLDERFKRYSYGPPVESIAQMLALITQGFMDMEFVHDPSIELDESGWTLGGNGREVECQALINAVLDSPKPAELTSPLIYGMLRDELLEIVYSDLGIMTDSSARVMTSSGKGTQNIYLLGRLAKGSVIGVDAITECFGPRVVEWARHFVRNWKLCQVQQESGER